MKLVVDTNVLVRAAVGDDERQAAVARSLLSQASLIAAPLPTLCEFVWVLRKLYGLERTQIVAALPALVAAANVVVDAAAVEAGLAAFAAGGDFEDGVIAFEGERLGGETFVSFDRKAVALLTRLGRNAELLESAG